MCALILRGTALFASSEVYVVKGAAGLSDDITVLCTSPVYALGDKRARPEYSKNEMPGPDIGFEVPTKKGHLKHSRDASAFEVREASSELGCFPDVVEAPARLAAPFNLDGAAESAEGGYFGDATKKSAHPVAAPPHAKKASQKYHYTPCGCASILIAADKIAASLTPGNADVFRALKYRPYRLFASAIRRLNNPQPTCSDNYRIAQRLLLLAAKQGHPLALIYVHSPTDFTVLDQSCPALHKPKVSEVLDVLVHRYGSAEAMYLKGKAHRHGILAPRDNQAAFDWYHESASLGHLAAQNALALAYELGVGTPVDTERGRKWMTLAAEQGNIDAQYNLGTRYAQREYPGYAYAPDTAVEWLTRAAYQGYESAFEWLAHLYDAGYEAPADRRLGEMGCDLAF